MLKRNVGKMDRGARVALGLAFLAGYFANGDAGHGWLYLVGAAVMLATGLLGACGVYSLFGVNTCRVK